jgi:hypothetical protein
MHDIISNVAASGHDLSDRDLAIAFKKSVVSPLLSGSTFQRTSRLSGVSIVGVTEIAHRNGHSRPLDAKVTEKAGQ